MKNLEGELLIFKNMGIKPNFSELAKIYGINRHTISKYWKEGGKKVSERRSSSRLDEYLEEITAIVEKPGVTRKAAHEYMCDKYGRDKIGKYSTFRTYIWSKGIKVGKSKKAHVRFETEPGSQLQVDWKENMELHTQTGEEIRFNILSATLGYSRLHVFIYTKGKTTEDFIRCVIDVLKQLGGCPKEILTDNMVAVVSITNGSKHKHQKITNFEKDTGISIKLCQVRSPQTKGKDESCNRFINWLIPYDYQLESEEQLINLVEQLSRKVNNEVNQTTGLPPIVLFGKEKEYLTALPNKLLLDDYVESSYTAEVPETLLVNYKGHGYSVPAKYIGSRVKIYPIENKLYIYFNKELISVHEVSEKKFNYHSSDYIEGLKTTMSDQYHDIDQIAKENLKLLDSIGE